LIIAERKQARNKVSMFNELNFEFMRKYTKPTTQVVKLQQQTQLLVSSVHNTENFYWGEIAPEEEDV
jgi:hypothetical protein